ncbi:Sodium/calcium exchanger protein-domain-containing protein [Podospora appendiculata]|uniref:Sodium/calcium exchanger protein-domain-containing protein n=1 Tax=Podospora appendiculata TaxID=314037 RepID=A0AAE0X2N3_9PEZI|nr:Sodium/calcium exchanger protein-domain-containing protein [Podospora appendiculata]
MKNVEFDRSSKIYTTVLLALTTVYLLLLTTLQPAIKWLAGSLLIVAFVVYVGSVATLIYRGTLTAPEDDSDSDSDSDSDGDVSDDSSDSGASEMDGPVDEEQGGGGWRASSDKGHKLGLLKTSKKSTATKKPKVFRPNKKQPKTMRYHLFRLLMGLAALLVSSYIIAHSASTIGNELALSGTVVGTTILSLATTLPEKFVAIIGGVRHQPGIMVANTVGSNIFLVTLCGGVLFLWGDASQLQVGFSVFEALIMWLSAVVIFGIVMVGGKRWMGGVMLSFYIGFLVVEIMNGHKVDDD